MRKQRNSKYAVTYSDAGSVVKFPAGMFTPKDGGNTLKNYDVSVISQVLSKISQIKDFRLVAVTVSSTATDKALVEWDNGTTVQTDYTLKPIRVKPNKASQESFWQAVKTDNDNTLFETKGQVEYIELAVRFENF